MKLQFHLRTLMIAVTLLAVPLGYVGWQAKIVRERKATIKRIVADGGQAVVLTSERLQKVRAYIPDAIREEVPFIRRWLGDEHVLQLRIPGGTSFDLRRMTELFPEASVID